MCRSIFRAPQFLIPFFVFCTGYLPVLGGSVEALVAQMRLEQSEAVSGVIQLHRMDCESIAQAVWADVMNYAGLTVDQPCQSSPFAAVPHNLPGAVAVNAKNQLLPVSKHCTTAPHVFLEQL